MQYKLLACKMLERELASLTYKCKNRIDVTMIQQQLHQAPLQLNNALQEEIDAIDNDSHRYSNNTNKFDYDAILLGYGLCCNSVLHLHSNKYPIVIPRAHDCVTLMMGNKEDYRQYHTENTGTYYYWTDVEEINGLNASECEEKQFQRYLERHHGDEKKARRLLNMEFSLLKGYKKLTYIKWNDSEFPNYDEKAKRICSKNQWIYEEYLGNNVILKNMLDGNWPRDQFLVIPPGYTAIASFDDDIFELVPVVK